MAKYTGLRQRIQASAWSRVELLVPPAADDRQLGLAHADTYVARVRQGQLDRDEMRRIGFPWSPGLVERSRRSAGATIEACRAALEDGVGVNLAGGTHHAFRDRGEGFCVFNDSVVAARVMHESGKIRRSVVLDCDVHQGNGTAALASGDDNLFAFSIHGEKNYPYRKEQSDLDIALPDGTGDDDYLAALESGLHQALERARPELAFFVSGADPWQGDRWGRLALTKQGLARRDRLVLETCKRKGIPVAISMAGGYAPAVEDIVDIHHETVRTAHELFGE